MILKHCVEGSIGNASYYEYLGVTQMEEKDHFNTYCMPGHVGGSSQRLCVLILRTILLDRRYWYPHLKIEKTKVRVSEVMKESNYLMAQTHGYLIPQPNLFLFCYG